LWYGIENMDIRQLKYFVAVAEERNIGRAATRLHMSQPPLTRQIQQLETSLGVALFVRTPRGVELTAAGAELLRDARSIGSMMEAATERAQRAGKGQIGRLDIGVYGSAMFDIVPRILHDFRRSHPDVKLVLHPGQTPQQVQALKQGRIQIAFERLVPVDPDIKFDLVAREPLYVALRSDHPLAQRETIDISALAHEPLIVNSAPGSRIRAKAVDLFRSNGIEPILAHDSEDVIIAAAMVASGDGICLVPASLTNLHMPHLAYRPLKARGDATMDLYCMYLSGAENPLLQSFLAGLPPRIATGRRRTKPPTSLDPICRHSHVGNCKKPI
jgi:LysR family transcriptional regulator, benzoate and cis,cis-muconate-responsive activator of ben and cat genes